MNDGLLSTVESLRSSVRILRNKFIRLKSDMEALSLEFDKMLDKFDKVGREADSYKEKLRNQYERRYRLVEIEVRNKTLKEIRDNFAILDEAAESKLDTLDSRIASTVSIFETFMDVVSGGNDGFRMMCQSAVFPCIYEKLLSRNVDDYVLLKVPEEGVEMAELGRDFAKSVIARAPYQLSSTDMWDQFSGEVVEWWKTFLVPYLYGDRDPDLSEDPYDLDTMKKWRYEPECRLDDFPAISDALSYLKSYKDEVDSANGVNKLMSAFSNGVNFY